MTVVIDFRILKTKIEQYIKEFDDKNVNNRKPINDKFKETIPLIKDLLSKIIKEKYSEYNVRRFKNLKLIPIPSGVEDLYKINQQCILPQIDKFIGYKSSYEDNSKKDRDGFFTTKDGKAVLFIHLYDVHEKDYLIKSYNVYVKMLNESYNVGLFPKINNYYLCATSDFKKIYLTILCENPGRSMCLNDWMKTKPSPDDITKAKEFLLSKLKVLEGKVSYIFDGWYSIKKSLNVKIDNNNRFLGFYFSHLGSTNENMFEGPDNLKIIKTDFYNDGINGLFTPRKISNAELAN